MNNDVLLVPIIVEQPNVEAQSDIVVYVPQAHKNKAGIVKEGDGIIVENGVVSLDKTLVQDMVDAVDAALTDEILDVDDKIVAHINDFENPHRVTKEQIGLSNVDNTSDLDKPISSATKLELDKINEILIGINKGIAYSTYKEMVGVLNSAQKTEFFVGQSIFIGTQNVPDLWVYGVESTSQHYDYIDDESIVDAIETDGFVRIGYYKISALETQKTIVGNYVTLDTPQTITSWKNFDISEDINDRLTLIHDSTHKELSLRYSEDLTNKSTFVYMNPKRIDINPSDSFGVETQTGGYLWLSDFVVLRTDITQENKSSITMDNTRITLQQNNDVLSMGYGSLLYNNKQLMTEDALSDYVTLNTIQNITGTKVFTEQIGILNGSEGEINYIKHINNNFLISSSDGENIVNIDEQLRTFNFYNKPIALEEHVKNNYISYTTQQLLTEEQKQIARNNIGAGTGGGGSVDLSNYVTLNTAQTITGKKTINCKDSDGSEFVLVMEPYEFWLKAGDDVNYIESYNTFGELDVVGSSVVRLRTPTVSIPAQDGRRHSASGGLLDLRTDVIVLKSTNINSYEESTTVKITPQGFFYNDKEVAIKDDISTSGAGVTIVWWEN